MTALLAAVPVAAHAALPVALRHAWPGSAALRRAGYARVTAALAVVALAAVSAAPRRGSGAPRRADGPGRGEGAPGSRGPIGRGAVALLVPASAAAAGGALPVAVLAASRRPRPLGRVRLGVAAGGVVLAAAEEILWRLALPRALAALGAPRVAAAGVGAAGFAAMHVPAFGRRRLPYLSLAAALFAAAGLAGWPAAAAAHAAHNLVIDALAAGVRPRRAGAETDDAATGATPAEASW